MGERSEYPPGTFSWADLATTDQAAAKGFYGELFGWEADDMPVGDDSGTVYSMVRVGDKHVGAISPQPEQQRAAGVPPMWNNYITVESADDTARRAQELGAAVHAPPFDVLTVGRMAVIQDPQGAFFMLWEPRDHHGASLVNAPGALCWNELAVPDLDAAASFYGQLFGWDCSPMEGSPTPYLIIRNGERTNGGIREPGPGEPPNWTPYFAIEDLDAGLATLDRLGGTTMVGPNDIGIARIAAVKDPQGAVFALYSGQLDD
jgi:predicted enzyme related to lactoylglutathione lyase